jgi:hypothetical protein
MVFITKKMENVMSMYDERVAELESLLEASDERYLESERRVGYEMKQRELLTLGIRRRLVSLLIFSITLWRIVG